MRAALLERLHFDLRTDEAGARAADLDFEHAAASHEIRRPRRVRLAARAGICRQVRAGVQAVAPAVEVAEALMRRAGIDEISTRDRVERLVEVELLRARNAVAAEVAHVLDLDLDA